MPRSAGPCSSWCATSAEASPEVSTARRTAALTRSVSRSPRTRSAHRGTHLPKAAASTPPVDRHRLVRRRPQVFVDQLSRTPESLTKHFANYLKTNRPEDGDDGDPARDRPRTYVPVPRRRLGSSPVPRRTGLPSPAGNRRPDPRRRRHRRRPARSVLRQHDRQVLAGGIHVVHAGGATGLFSMAFSGWVPPPKGSVCTTKEITR